MGIYIRQKSLIRLHSAFKTAGGAVPVVWTNTFGVGTYTDDGGGGASKTATAGYAGGRTSNQLVTTGQAVLTVVVPTGIECFVGFLDNSIGAIDPNYENKDFAFYFDATNFYYSETSGSANTVGPLARSNGDIFTISFDRDSGNKATVRQNGTIRYNAAGSRSKSGMTLRPWVGGNTLGTILTSATIDVG